MASERLRYVNTASTAGGDGTTNNTTGATRAYVSLAAAITAEAANLVTADVFLVIKCDGAGGDDTAVVDITGYTTDATRSIKIMGNDGVGTGRHAGKDAGTTYTLATNTSGHVVQVNEPYCEFEGFIVGPMGASHGSSDEAFRVNQTGCLWDGMIVHDLDTSTHQDAIYFGGNGLTATVKNCLFYNLSRSACLIQGRTNCHFIVYNCTAYECLSDTGSPYAVFGPDNGAARNNTGSDFRVKNCAGHRTSGSSSVVYREGGASGQECFYTADSDNNMASDTSAGTVWNAGAWANAWDNTVFQAATTPTTGNRYMVTSLTAASEDFHLLDDANNDAKGNGIDLSADATHPFGDDIDFAARPTGSPTDWDIGADQVAAGAATRSVLASLEGAIQRQLSIATSLDAGVQAGSAKAASTDAVLAHLVMATANLDSALRAMRGAQTGLDAALRVARTDQSAADGVLQAVHTLSGAIEAAVTKAIDVAAALDANVITEGMGVRAASLDAALTKLIFWPPAWTPPCDRSARYRPALTPVSPWRTRARPAWTASSNGSISW